MVRGLTRRALIGGAAHCGAGGATIRAETESGAAYGSYAGRMKRLPSTTAGRLPIAPLWRRRARFFAIAGHR
jgi:hypothetical protein